MRALDVDAEHESLSGVGPRARVETRHQRAAELHLALALLLRLDTVGAEVEECLGAQLFRELDRDGKPVAVAPGEPRRGSKKCSGRSPSRISPSTSPSRCRGCSGSSNRKAANSTTPPESRARRKFIAGLPMNVATNVFAGRL